MCVKTSDDVGVIIVIIQFLYSANSRMGDRCARNILILLYINN